MYNLFVRPGPTLENVKFPPSELYPNGSWSHSDEALLTEGGETDARKIGNKFKFVKFDECYTSKAERTCQTAQLILDANVVSPKIEKIKTDALYEMRLGRTDGKEPNEIIQIFMEATRYPSPESKKGYPKIWDKLNGQAITDANDVYLDHWDEEIDDFANFSKKCLNEIIQIAQVNLGKSLLFVLHGTPFKTLIAAAKEGVTSDKVKVARGAFGIVTIDVDGKVTLKKASKQITLKGR